MELKAVFSFDTTKIYNLVSGSVIKEQYNETLDSATLILTNISESNKPTLSPYDYVYVYDKDSDFKRYFIIDNYVESFINQDEKIYNYSISCFSPTKILEKIQLPNRTITHVLDSDNETPIQTTIREEVYKMCQLYIPKVKIKNTDTTWTYDYLIDFSDLTISTSDLYKKLDIDCPDFTWNKPTLREVLNSLFNVVSCLPTISNRTLGFLDLDVDGNAFDTHDKNLDMKSSLSSDSYVNELVVDSDNVIGDDNTIVSETLGFRNVESAIISSANLELNTSYPIADIKSLKMKTLSVVQLINNVGVSFTSVGSAFLCPFYRLNYFEQANRKTQPLFIDYVNNTDTIILGNNCGSDITITDVNIYEIDIPNMVATRSDFDIDAYPFKWVVSADGTTNRFDTYNNKKLLYSFDSITIADGDEYNVGTMTIETNIVYMTYKYNNKSYIMFVDTDNATGFDYGVGLTQLGIEYNNEYCYFIQLECLIDVLYDITKLVKENSARKMLATSLGYVPTDIDDMATWYYTTIGYTYGDTKITGFSQKYSYVDWTLIRNKMLIDILYSNYDDIGLSGDPQESIIKIFNRLFSVNLYDYYADIRNSLEVYDPSTISPYALFSFNVEYQPMNSTIIKYSKQDRDIPFAIQQLDNQEASIPAFKSMSLREQEKIDRLGNETLNIHQSLLTDLSEINDLATKYHESIIFSREIQYYDDFAEVNYTATKDYILKNYFTSIATKYRAYQYVDYNNTTLRKENIKKYLLIDEYYIDGDDDFCSTLRFGSLDYTGKTDIVDYFVNTDVNCKLQCNVQIVSEVLGSPNELYKNEMSILTYNKGIALTFKDFDSVSGGIYFSDALLTTYNKIKQALDTETGGWIQQWHIRDNQLYNASNTTLFSSVMLENYMVYGTSSTNAFADYINLPKVNTTLVNFSTNTEIYNVWLERCLTYKSQDEVLSRTLQIEAYTTSSNILIGSDFMKYAPINNDGTNVVKWLKLSVFSLGIVNYSTEMEISLNLSENTIEKGFNDIVGLCLIKNNKATPLLVINEGVENAYLSINATKTNKVYSIDNGTGLLTLNRTLKVNENTKLLN